LYRCPSCGGLAHRKRPWLATLHGFGFAVLSFPLLYWVVSQGFSVWTIPAVIGIFVLVQMLNVAADWMTNDYVPADRGEH
jgi:hypothetical protein